MTSRTFLKRVDVFLRGAHFFEKGPRLSLVTEIHYSDSELFESASAYAEVYGIYLQELGN